MSDHDPLDEPTQADTPVTDPTMAMPASAGGPPPVEPPPPTDEPPPPPRDRRPWILGGLIALIVALGLAVVLLRDDDETASTTESSTTTEETTTTSTESTTATTAPTTTTIAPTTTSSPSSTVAPALCVSSGPDEPEPTAEVVYDAFTLGDRACAENLATAEAIDQLFSIPGAGAGWTFEGCLPQDVPDPHTLCSYRFEGGSTGFRMNYSDTEGWTVYEVFQVAD